MTFTAENFDTEVLKSELPVVVDFWFEGCPPCKALAPIIEDLMTEFSGTIKIGKLNVRENEANTDVAVKYKVTHVPTLLVFKGGEVVDSLPTGSKTELRIALGSL